MPPPQQPSAPPIPPIIFTMPSIISCMPAGGFAIAPEAGVAADPITAEAGTASDPIVELSPAEASGRAPAGGRFGLAGSAAAG